MENDTAISYTNVEFLSNNELLVKDTYNLELFTVHSIKKFKYTFDVPVHAMLYRGGLTDYTLVTDNAMEEVRLK